MTERDWELYRLSVVQQLPAGPYKDAIIGGIEHKLTLLDQQQLTQATRQTEGPQRPGRR
jgi:hypothetical protein